MSNTWNRIDQQHKFMEKSYRDDDDVSDEKWDCVYDEYCLFADETNINSESINETIEQNNKQYYIEFKNNMKTKSVRPGNNVLLFNKIYNDCNIYLNDDEKTIIGELFDNDGCYKSILEYNVIKKLQDYYNKY